MLVVVLSFARHSSAPRAERHQGHDYRLVHSGGGVCDCGDTTAWAAAGACSKHRPGAAANADADPALRERCAAMAAASGTHAQTHRPQTLSLAHICVLYVFLPVIGNI